MAVESPAKSGSMTCCAELACDVLGWPAGRSSASEWVVSRTQALRERGLQLVEDVELGDVDRGV